MDLTADLLARAEAVNHLTLRSPYGYIPSKAPGIAYVVVFAALTLAHIGLGIRYRYWLVFATLVPGGLRECYRFIDIANTHSFHPIAWQCYGGLDGADP